MNRPRVVLVDDDPAVLETLGEWLAVTGHQVRTAREGAEALRLLRQSPADVLVTDLDMPRMNGLQLLSLVKEAHPDIEVVFLSGKGSIESTIAALRAGRAFDFLLKPIADFDRFNEVIERAYMHACERTQALLPIAEPWPDHLDALSERELQVVKLVAESLNNREIANRLVLSERTVGNHLSRIYEKLQVSNRTGAVVLCRRHGLV